MKHRTKKDVAMARDKAYGKFYERLDTGEKEKNLCQLARQR